MRKFPKATLTIPAAKMTRKQGTWQRRNKIKQTKHGAWVTTPDRKIYNRAYQKPEKNNCPQEINKA